MITSSTSQCIDAWVAEQMQHPWPLTSVQLDLLRRTLARPTQTTDVSLTPDAA